MKILGEELGEIGRWYIVLPPVLLIGFLIGLFLLAAAGQSRLTAADMRIHRPQDREQALDEFLALIADAESEQRGYLLTGKDSYPAPDLCARPRAQSTDRPPPGAVARQVGRAG
jgi:hypothetical protein